MKKKTVVVLAFCGAFVLPACRAGARSAEQSASPAEGTSKSSNPEVRLDPSQLKQVRIEELSTFAPADVIKATGTVEFNADRMARILPPVPGQVQDLAVNAGDSVRKSDVLFVLRSREVAAAIADHLASHKDLELAEKTFAMTQDLFEHEAASRIALQQSENELAKSRAKVEQAEEVLQVLGLDAHTEEDAAHLQSRVPVRVEADVFERDLRHINAGQKADVTAAAYPNDHFNAQVARIGAVIVTQTRTAKVRFLVANPNARLKPGMYTSMTLYLPESSSALTLPAKAVFVENSRTFAYVQTGPLAFSRREIETAAGSPDRLRVVRGLEPGDRVVADGVLLLRQLDSDTGGDR